MTNETNGVSLIARVNITTPDDKFYLQGAVMHDEDGDMCCSFVLYEYYDGHYSKCHEEMPLGYSFKDTKGECLNECVKFLENWFEINLERVEYTTEVIMCEGVFDGNLRFINNALCFSGICYQLYASVNS